MICNVFGNRWRKRIRVEEAPICLEAVMNSNSRTRRVSPRIILAAPGHEKAPIMKTTSHIPPVAPPANLMEIWRNTRSRRKKAKDYEEPRVLERRSAWMPQDPSVIGIKDDLIDLAYLFISRAVHSGSTMSSMSLLNR